MKNSDFYAVIMAGGYGERFWPAGRHNKPKQLLPLLGSMTMIEETVQRLFPMFEPDHILVMTNMIFVDQIRSLLPIPPENVIGEPERRDTAPCIALAAALIMRKSPNAVMALLSSDGMIRPVKAFQETLKNAAVHAQAGALVTIGIQPSYPATGYGYIHEGDSIAPGFSKVLEFREKPDLATAEQFFRDGNYKWNAGIFLWRTDVIANAFERYAPELGKLLRNWANGGDYRLDFAQAPKISIDYAIMEKSENVIVGNAPFYWNDIGSWSALRAVFPLDAQNNAFRGNVLTVDSSNNVAIADENMLIGMIGMHDTAVIKSGNGILVCPISEEQRVKELTARIKEEYPDFL